MLRTLNVTFSGIDMDIQLYTAHNVLLHETSEKCRNNKLINL